MNNQYLSRRKVTYAKNQVVASSEGLASQAGYEILKKGGNAIDAAVACAAALTVVEPCSNGIGSDCFAIVHFEGKTYGLNSSGYSSRNISIDKVKERGYTEMPKFGVVPVTVPGTPKGWASLIKKFGTLSLEEVLQPAVNLARNGFCLSETVGHYFDKAIEVYQKSNKTAEYNHFFRTFTDNGRRYKAGDFFRNDDLADTLEEIGKTAAQSFYKGDLAEKIVKFMKKHNGFIDENDLAKYDCHFVEPMSLNYKGYDILELPPNGQGLTCLMALNLLKDKEVKKDDIQTLHKQIEAIKIAFSDTHKYLTDPKFMEMKPEYFISNEYIELREKDLTDKAKLMEPIDYKSSGTVYLATADKRGNMVSFIQSNYMGFGSGLVVDGTGISLQNRGHTFSLDPDHANALEPRKKTYHTIIPGFIKKNDAAIGPFGVMGGFMQPQGHLQVLMNMIDFDMNPQEALDAPRFRWDKELKVALETYFDESVKKDLEKLGHKAFIDPSSGGFGRGQIIINKKDHYEIGTETRCNGHIAYD
ncbi:MAG: gamma-glutamyltransferase family protein [Tenericutes bacterium]|jgi:gamma-glutamyltranspeptidase/glutathione hydrolase|nr:gamma-glutamyltransferase family protein [Mycoplasmatota bacterium]